MLFPALAFLFLFLAVGNHTTPITYRNTLLSIPFYL
jgi:hypothetical protein